MNLFRIVMSAALLSAPVFACTEADGDVPDYVAENEPIETELGYFTLELEADSGQRWPQSTGRGSVATT